MYEVPSWKPGKFSNGVLALKSGYGMDGLSPPPGALEVGIGVIPLGCCGDDVSRKERTKEHMSTTGRLDFF